MTSLNRLPRITVTDLLERFEGLLFDAYGVLVDDEGALPGAVELIDRLNRLGRPYCVLTNSASRLPETTSAHFRTLGLDISPGQIVCSGELLAPHFAEHGLAGRATVVLGPADSQTFAERAGARVVKPAADCDAEVVVFADEAGYPLLEHLNHVLSAVLRRLDSGLPVRFVVCNPDQIYPQGPGRFGFTAGALAAMYQTFLQERYGSQAPTFEHLGKPYAPAFEEAIRRVGTRNAAMVGDQLATDILGANRAEIAAVLVTTGLGGTRGIGTHGARPDWLLESLTV